MLEFLLFDAAGDTGVDFPYATSKPKVASVSSTKLFLRAKVLEGPFKGETAITRLLGEFDLKKGIALIEDWRTSIGGEAHYEIRFDDRVSLQDLFSDFDAAFTGGFLYLGNRFDNLLRGDRGDDKLIGDGGYDVMKGYGGDDLLDGRHRSLDKMLGGKGDDVYLEFGGNRGEDRIIEKAGQGYDVVGSYSQGYTLTENVEELRMERTYANTVNALGNDLDNVIYGSKGRDFINAFGGDDRVFGRSGDDIIASADGNDILRGGAGDDEIWDYAGRNKLYGQAGDDVLMVGQGRNTLNGGSGDDAFWFEETEPESRAFRLRDVITDFETGVDTLNLSAIDAIAGTARNDAFIFIGSAEFSAAGQARLHGDRLTLDVDGNGQADLVIAFNGGTPVEADMIL